MHIISTPITFGLSESPESFGFITLIHQAEEDPQWLSTFSEMEKAVFSKHIHEARKKSYLLGRYCAKQAICHLLQISSPSSISIVSGEFRYPLIRGINQNGLSLSLAHSGSSGLALAHFDTYLCGVDIESINSVSNSSIRSLLTDSEKLLLSQLPLDEKAALTLAWSAKESLSKAVKTGLTIPFSFFEIVSIERHALHYEVSYKHFRQYTSINFPTNEMMLSIAKPKTVAIYGLDPLFRS